MKGVHILLLCCLAVPAILVDGQNAGRRGGRHQQTNTRGFGLVNQLAGAAGALLGGFGGRPGHGSFGGGHGHGGFGGHGQGGFGGGHGHGGFGGHGQGGFGGGHGHGGFGGHGQGGFGGGHGHGGHHGGGSTSCRRWCRTPRGQAYCCEEGHEPESQVAHKPGFCPPVRPTCPPTRSHFGPQHCSSDGSCSGFDKCCFDTCLQEHVCKPPRGFGR